MHLTNQNIKETDRIKRLNLINAITGIKPANMIGTISKDQKTNLAIVSSVIHIGSDPALLGFISRTFGASRRHTYENVQDMKVFTINQVHSEITTKAHYTSVKFEKGISEFDRCHLTEEYIDGFKAPFVKESRVKIGLAWVETIPIRKNDTALLIGEVEHLVIPDEALDDAGEIDLEYLDGTGVSGLNTYYRLQKSITLPYDRFEELPDFIR
jgi:flavin reductase (DIM6/NTAB) family NADH-FMN oxidoreductase RutF